MKIQYCSDLHLEFSQNADYLSDSPLEPSGEVLILAGDITNLHHYNTRKTEKAFLKKCSKQFEQVYWICGNHEFYRSWDASRLNQPMHIQIEKNVHLLHNMSVVYHNVRFLFTTLWSYIGDLEGLYIQQRMADFELISYSGRTLTTGIYTNKLHRPSLAFLQAALIQPCDLPTVVVTHHLPSLQCVHLRHQGSLLNQGFATDLDDFILQTQPYYWMYGHSHSNMPVIEIWRTRLITNQLGYCGYGEGAGFDPQKWIEL